MVVRRLLALVLTVLIASPSAAQTLRESVAVAARTEVLQPAAPARGPMPKGLWWTGVALLGAGGVTILMGAAIKNGECDLDFESDCDALGTGFYVLGGAMAGTGGVLMAIAGAKRERLPSLSFTRRGAVVVRHRIAF